MDKLADICGIFLIREDVPADKLQALRQLLHEAKKKDLIDYYIGSPYNRILDIVEMRIDADDVTMGIYDAMVDANFVGEEHGYWNGN